MSEDRAPDPLAVLRAIGVAGVRSTERTTGGFDTLVWRVATDGGDYALRVFHPGQDDRQRREAAAMSAAADHRLPVPRVRAQGRWRDRPVLLLDWCPGRPLVHEFLERPQRAYRLGILFGTMQARIHTVPVPPGLTAEPWIEAAGPGTETIQRRLRALGPRADALIHLDYHPLNVLTDGRRITGVIDWANARGGDPRADLARTMTILRLDIRSFPQLVPPHAAPYLPLFDLGWRRGYTRTAGPGAAADLPAFLAWAGAAMERDLAENRSQAFLAHVHAWTQRWAARAGA